MATSHSELVSQDVQYLIHPDYSVGTVKNTHVWKSGKDALVWDIDGKEYIDGISGLYACQIGHGRREMVQIADTQLGQLEFISCFAGDSHVPAIKLAERIVMTAQQAFPAMRSVHFTNGGSEANEAAYSMALYHWAMSGMPLKTKLIAFNKAYHGSSFIPASLSENPLYSMTRLIGPMHNFFLKTDFPSESTYDRSKMEPRETVTDAAIRHLEAVIIAEGHNNIAAIFAEPIQGDAGIVVPPKDWWPRVRKLCDKYNILLIADEVLTGFGRTGKWFAMEHWNVQPDMITFAKGATSGYAPLGGLIINDKLKTTLDQFSSKIPWSTGFTFSGHPLCCVIGLRNMDILTSEHLIAESARKGKLLLQWLKQKLSDLTVVKNIRGMGLLIGIELTGAYASDAQARLLEEGVIARANKTGYCLNLAPPFVTTEEQLHAIVTALHKVFSNMALKGTMGIAKEAVKGVVMEGLEKVKDMTLTGTMHDMADRIMDVAKQAI